MLKLTREDLAEGQTLQFGQGIVRIGRAVGNDLVLPVTHISSSHARIRWADGEYLISDLGSTNGSVIVREGKRLLLGPKGEAEIPLRSGDLLLLGDIDSAVRLKVAIEEPPALQAINTIVAARTRPQTAEVSRRVSADHQTLQLLFRLVSSFNQSPDRQQLFSRLTDAALQAFVGAVDALLVLREDRDWRVLAEAHRGRGVSDRANTKICEMVIARGEALLFGQHSSEIPAATLVDQGIGSGIAAPLWREREVIGVLQINCQPGRLELGEAQLDLAVVLAHHAAVALERADLIDRLRRAQAKLREENIFLRRRAQPSVTIVAQSPAMRSVLADLERAAATDVTVLLQGETGTGKEVAARHLHALSQRADRLLVPVNCGALSEALLDSELFGHRKGAFTGATSDHKGVFEVADGGTVFLDEVGEMPPPLQVRLLRVLEEGRIRRVGEAVERPVDVRIIAASNRDLGQLVEQRGFRQDLYYRLRVFPILLPPLRERPDDIAPLCRLFIGRHAERLGKTLGPIDPSLVEALRGYAFPGNVRELVNELERAAVRARPDEPLTADLLSEEVLAAVPTPVASAGQGSGTLREQLDEVERQIIIRTLQRHDGRRAAAAAELGLTRQGLAKKITRLGI